MIVQIVVAVSRFFNVHMYSIPYLVTIHQLKCSFLPVEDKKEQRIHPPTLKVEGFLRFFINSAGVYVTT